MQKFLLKTVSIISFFLAIIFLEGCSNNEIITERYENKMYEYSLDVPRNWGAVWIWPNSHELVDEMEAIGPVPNSRADWNEDIEIEIFNKENTSERVFKEYDSLIDFYEEFRLGNSVHFTDVKLNKLLTNKKNVQ